MERSPPTPSAGEFWLPPTGERTRRPAEFVWELCGDLFVSTPVPLLSRTSLCLVLAAALLVTSSSRAAVAFSQILTPAERSATGYAHLKSQQVTALDALIQRDIDAARQGNVTGFARTFTQRRTPEERVRAGIDQLTEIERGQLDRLVAATLASRPVVPYIAPPPSADSPAEVTLEKAKPKVHGQVSAFYGQSSGGGSFYGGSFDAMMIDPTGKYAIGIGLSEIRTRGMRSCIDGPLW